MTGERSYTTKIWRQPSSIEFSSADALSTSTDPPGEPVISTRKRPCQKIQNGSEFPELVAQNSRNPQREHLNPNYWPTRYRRWHNNTWESCAHYRKMLSRWLFKIPLQGFTISPCAAECGLVRLSWLRSRMSKLSSRVGLKNAGAFLAGYLVGGPNLHGS